jgi:hypothetical protein
MSADFKEDNIWPGYFSLANTCPHDTNSETLTKIERLQWMRLLIVYNRHVPTPS